jgi:hypothetical protein
MRRMAGFLPTSLMLLDPISCFRNLALNLARNPLPGLNLTPNLNLSAAFSIPQSAFTSDGNSVQCSAVGNR